MNDTPEHVRKLQLELWLKKTPGERHYQTIIEIEAMSIILRDAKTKLGLPLGDLDPVGEYLKKKKPPSQEATH
ncbi:MAG: hypothetical protein SGI96_09000 [Bacteroidota bacterium]|nr:hypothetical protein [Bacteroidota bacterium]